MAKITVYKPICSSNGEKCWFTVNGATSPNRDEAISKAMKHVGIRDGAGKIERVDEIQVDEEDWYSPKSY